MVRRARFVGDATQFQDLTGPEDSFADMEEPVLPSARRLNSKRNKTKQTMVDDETNQHNSTQRSTKDKSQSDSPGEQAA